MVHCTDTKENYDVAVTTKLYAWYSNIIVITQDPWTESLQNISSSGVGFQTPDNQDFNGVQKVFKNYSHD